MSAPVVLNFDGAPPEGQSVVRFVFVDEGGISRDEPFAVVAAVFVHGDTQLVRLETELDRLKRKHIPEEYRRDFFFHAKDIWSGNKIFKDRDVWPLHKRLKILHDLARLPGKLDIPIVWEAVERSKFDLIDEVRKAGREPTPFEILVAVHSLAFCACTLRIEQFMRAIWKDEVAQMVVEDNDQVRTFLKSTHEVFRDPSKAEQRLLPNNILPLRKVRGSLHFASKAESGPLQLADICAFIIRGHLARHPHNPPLYKRVKRKLLMLPGSEESDPDKGWPTTGYFQEVRRVSSPGKLA
jgi:hypothetical protein